ncbi:MBL fold metallo-hydrolase [Streptomyces sp. NPDC093272]|uniref:MBL fold metallo-hydrolase n=1 Tax=Streptomyces sp. NPDC093272 TaxID=3154981 RepID=UPI0034195CB3
MSVTRVHHLNCASIQGLSILGQHLICHVLLLETADSGLVLVDTGLGTADYADPTSRLGAEFVRGYARPRIDGSLAAVHQIRALGFDPKDVRHIVQTHLDLDHVGGLSDFPQAAVHVHATELEMAMRRPSFKARRRYRPRMWEHNPDWRTYRHGGQQWFGFEAVRGLEGLPEDILLVPLFGHTHGHCGVAVNSGGQWLLAAGDAYFDAREIKLPRRACAPGPALFQMVATTEFKGRRLNQDRLRALHAEHPEIEIFAAHNPFEYLDLLDGDGGSAHGIHPAKRFKPRNRAVGAARAPRPHAASGR